MTFPEFLSGIDLLSVFNRKILPKKGGGRDNVSPEIYKKTFVKELEWLKGKLADGSYRFAPYKEKLIVKGKGKYPRVLSLPSVRDRLVLSILNSYITSEVGLTYMIPNLYIQKIQEFINTAHKDGKDIYFFKTDISSFYDNINHSILLNSLANKIDGIALKLVAKAITTPTVSSASQTYEVNTLGIPQGLAISNILSSIYIERFHKDMERRFADGLFLRYVDDILVLSATPLNAEKIITDGIARHNLNLSLTKSKTISGKIEDGFDYIGYYIKDAVISVRKKNRDKFSDRLVKRCTLLRKQKEDPSLRPRFASGDKEFLDYASTDLNLMISGFRTGNHNYGWISYYQRINDLTLLYQFDRLIRKTLGKDFTSAIELNSLVETYFNLKNHNSGSLLIDFDKITDRGSRIAYLLKFGYLKASETADVSDEEIDRIFRRMIFNLQKNSLQDIAETS